MLDAMESPHHARLLSEPFLIACETGILSPLLERVRIDATLDAGIRREELAIYYRGARMVFITPSPSGFSHRIDENFLSKASPRLVLPKTLSSQEDVLEFVASIPLIKEAIDFKLGEDPKDEREYQQLVMRENNDARKLNGTDFLICDLEYSHPDVAGMRLDLVAARWPSDPVARKRTDGLELALIEMKFGDAALGSDSGKSGLLEHFQDMRRVSSHFEALKREMASHLAQKARLGLLRRSELGRKDRRERIGFSPHQKKVDWILLLAGHDPSKRTLGQELSKLQGAIREAGELAFEVKVAVSAFSGYGLYDQGILDLDTFLATQAHLIGM